ncbi:protein N-terminal asparagine amidohydrolase [Hydra vulgaris]|nr:protein N-terminal asparagine amidohydrolase [Hydra vulgaris]
MVLFIDDQICSTYLKSLKVLEDSKSFVNRKKRELSNSDRVLYVAQREYATISPSVNCQNFCHIASDSATTCIIVVLVEHLTKSISLAHFDGADTLNGIKKMINELMYLYSKSSYCNRDPRFDLYLFGGFLDSKNLSIKLFNEIICACSQSKERIDLRIDATLNTNTTIQNNENRPIVYGVSVDIITTEIDVSSSSCCCPDFLLRNTRLLFSKNQSIVSVYDLKDQCITIPEFSIFVNNNLHQLLELPDDVYLKLSSTSPHCQPENFVLSGKSTIKFVLKYKSKDLFKNKHRRYFLTEKCNWEMLDKDHKLLS